MRSFISLFLFLSLSGISQNQDTLKKELKEVVITGQFTETSSEDAVHKIRVIGNKKLNSGIYNDLGNILEKELNIKLSQDNVLGSSISLQGISGQNVKILIDDIPVIGRMNGNIDLSQIKKRMALQMSDKEKIKTSNFIIYNNSDKNDLMREFKKVLPKLI